MDVDTHEKHLNQNNGNGHVDQKLVRKLNRLEGKLDKLENKEIGLQVCLSPNLKYSTVIIKR